MTSTFFTADSAYAERDGDDWLRLALNAAHVVAWELDLASGVLHSTVPLCPGGGVCSAVTESGPFKTFLASVHADDRSRVVDAYLRALDPLGSVAVEFRVEQSNGVMRWRQSVGRAAVDRDGVVTRFVGVYLDVTDRKVLEEELAHRAHRDPLTGLANHGLLHAAIGRVQDSAHRSAERRPGVLLVDLDDFNGINSAFGHAVGDRVLALVAARLLDSTRGSDVVARLGGDEFAVQLAVRNECEAVVVAERVLASLVAPFVVDGHAVHVGASIGIALADEGDDADTLLRHARHALHRAKELGKGRRETFVPEMHACAVQRSTLKGELRQAIDEQQLLLHYQPIVALDSREIVGLEALVRWQHPVRGTVAPNAFIPLADATGLVVPLGRWVLAEACRAAAVWTTAGTPNGSPVTISVNVSARQLQEPGLVDDVAAALTASGLDPQRLVLEVTESVLVRDVDAVLGRLQAIKSLGVRLALDDFGTGYSSLGYLQRLPVDVLKVDRTFTADVNEVAVGGRRAALTRGIVSLAESLGLHVVAEGVETEAQHAELVALGCGFGQGYLYARPLSSEAVERLLSRRRR